MDNHYRPFKDDTPPLRAMDQAYRSGVIHRAPLFAAIAARRGPSQWLDWARFWLLVYGIALLLAGVVFFFAYNWAGMHRFEKFALIQSGIVACILLAWRSSWRSALGQAFLVTGAVLVGVFLAVFGQVYQTGADAWQLFAGWSALIFIWVLAANSASLWVLWIAVADLAIVLNASQVQPRADFPDMLLLAGLVPLAVLALREWMTFRGVRWLTDVWLRPLLLLATLAFFTVPAIMAIVDGAAAGGRIAWLFAWLLLALPAFATYRWVFRDVLALTLIVFDASLLVLVGIAKGLFARPFQEGALLMFSIAIVGVVGAAYYWLRRLATEMHRESGHHDGEVRNASA